MSAADQHVQVAIAGGGPVGMSLALELGMRGVSSLVCDARAENATYPARSNLTNGRSMEHFRRWGIADRLRANDPVPPKFNRDVMFVTRATGKIIINLEGACEWRERQPISSEVPEWAPNTAIERTLREAVQDEPHAALQFATSVTDFVQDDDGVEVVYAGPSGARTVRADYLVLADGARSALRKKLNVRLAGETFTSNSKWHFRAPELEEILARLHLSSFVFFLNEDAYGDLLIAQSGNGHWMYMVAPTPEGIDADDWPAFERMLFRSVGEEFAIDEVSGGAWASHSRMAPRFDYGRVFLAGDAAHLTSPYGGFGMNLGIGDAVDLGWKLAAVLQGWGGARLLETYTIERQQAERFIIQGSQENQENSGGELVKPFMEEDSDRGQAARDEVVHLILTEKVREFVSLGAQFGYRYGDSPLIVRDGSEPPPLDYGVYTPSACPGCLAPHLWLADDSSLYDHFGDGFCLLRLDAAAAVDGLVDAAGELGVPLTVFDLRGDEARELYAATLVLVRPDQHVAWRGDALPDDCRLLLDTVTGSLGRRRGDTAAAIEPPEATDVHRPDPAGESTITT